MESVIIEDTLPANGSDKILAYPTGYNVSNCIVSGAMFEAATNLWYTDNHGGTYRFATRLQSDGIALHTNYSGASNANVRILLTKFGS